MDRKSEDNRSNQKNPNNDSYWKNKGYSSKPSDAQDKYKSSSSSMSKADQDYRSKQMNPNNNAYYKSEKR
uniref:Uncharacterized protein LOC114325782 n=1 Tax=Diabrotica virgifera virgifera TaxID=50390 RepID=A0A6P7F2Z3_DIAVI